MAQHGPAPALRVYDAECAAPVLTLPSGQADCQVKLVAAHGCVRVAGGEDGTPRSGAAQVPKVQKSQRLLHEAARHAAIIHHEGVQLC